MALTGAVVSPPTVTTINDAVDRIAALRLAIYNAAQGDEMINNDAGVEKFFLVVNAASRKFKHVDPKGLIDAPPALVEVLTTQVAPSITATAELLEQTWTNLQASVARGEKGAVIVDAFMANIEEDEEGPIFLLQTAIDEMQAILVNLLKVATAEAFAKTFG